MSSGDPRPRHRGLSHHTRTVLELLLVAGDGRASRRSPDWRICSAPSGTRATTGHERRGARPLDLDGYLASGLPARTMGRSLEEDELFFAAALAAGSELAAGSGPVAGEER